MTKILKLLPCLCWPGSIISTHSRSLIRHLGRQDSCTRIEKEGYVAFQPDGETGIHARGEIHCATPGECRRLNSRIDKRCVDGVSIALRTKLAHIEESLRLGCPCRRLCTSFPRDHTGHQTK